MGTLIKLQMTSIKYNYFNNQKLLKNTGLGVCRAGLRPNYVSNSLCDLLQVTQLFCDSVSLCAKGREEYCLIFITGLLRDIPGDHGRGDSLKCKKC